MHPPRGGTTVAGVRAGAPCGDHDAVTSERGTPTRGTPPKYRLIADCPREASRCSLCGAFAGEAGLMTSSSQSYKPAAQEVDVAIAERAQEHPGLRRVRAAFGVEHDRLVGEMLRVGERLDRNPLGGRDVKRVELASRCARRSRAVRGAARLIHAGQLDRRDVIVFRARRASASASTSMRLRRRRGGYRRGRRPSREHRPPHRADAARHSRRALAQRRRSTARRRRKPTERHDHDQPHDDAVRKVEQTCGSVNDAARRAVVELLQRREARPVDQHAGEHSARPPSRRRRVRSPPRRTTCPDKPGEREADAEEQPADELRHEEGLGHVDAADSRAGRGGRARTRRASRSRSR